MSEVISYIALLVAILALCATIYSIVVAKNSFKRSTTLQMEIFILNAYKSYMKHLCDESIQQQQLDSLKTQFLMAIDLYCKYILNGHLDNKLSSDNANFIKEVVITFEDTIRENLKDYNNINDYIASSHFQA